MDLNFFNISMLIGSFQGLILAIILYYSAKFRRENIFIALLILIISLKFLQFGIRDSNLHLYYKPLNYLPINMMLGVAPLIYFYIRMHTNKKFTFSRKYLVHFIPAFIEFSYRLIRFLFLKFENYLGSSILQISLVEEILFMISLLIYIIASFLYLKNTNNEIKNIKYLKLLLFAFSIYLVAYIASEISEMILYSHKYTKLDQYYVTFIYLIVLNYFISLKELYDLFRPQLKPNHLQESLLYDFKKINEYIIETKVYLQSDLDIRKLALNLQMKEKLVSATINMGSKNNFYNYINNLRIDDAKKMLSNPKYADDKIISIAFDCGFNSKSVFYNYFKKVTGMTPREFRNKI